MPQSPPPLSHHHTPSSQARAWTLRSTVEGHPPRAAAASGAVCWWGDGGPGCCASGETAADCSETSQDLPPVPTVPAVRFSDSANKRFVRPTSHGADGI